MIHLTDQERRSIIFLSAAIFFGLILDLSLKGHRERIAFLHILDDPSFYPRINVNRASREDLLSLARITPDMVQRILDHRRKEGDFKSMDELQQTLGLKRSRWGRLARQLKVK
jgi:hypothetical protein